MRVHASGYMGTVAAQLVVTDPATGETMIEFERRLMMPGDSVNFAWQYPADGLAGSGTAEEPPGTAEELADLLTEARGAVVDRLLQPARASRARNLLVRIDAALDRPQSDTFA